MFVQSGTLALGTLAFLIGGCASGQHAAAHASHASITPNATSAEVTRRLVEGNQRFVHGDTEHPRQGLDRRSELATGQKPFAVIVGCADSRTSPEILFDQGLGDLFIVRQAGNVVDDHALGSIEYAVEHLHAGTIVVLGHKRCGAVIAARDTVAAHGHAEGHVESLVNAIRPAVDATLGEDVEATCRANVRNIVHAIRTSEPVLHHFAEAGEITVVGAYYDLDTGVVAFLGEE